MPQKVLIVERESSPLAPTVRRIFSDHVLCETRGWEGLNLTALAYSGTDLVLAHIVADGESEMPLFRALSESSLPIPVLAILTGMPDQQHLLTIASAVDDFVFSPVNDEELTLRVTRLLPAELPKQRPLERILVEGMGSAQLVGCHPTFLRATAKVSLFAASEAPIIISGETGTGKELFAHAIHSLSARCKGPFIPVDCGTLPEQLAENELFGHCRGAFTDTHRDQKGLVGMAEGGTLFLDEIDALSLIVQSKLLRFLQERSYRALGSDHFTQANVRIIAATNRKLEECVQQGRFRSDLYFRLNILRLDLPALRDRTGDVSCLAKYFVENANAEIKREKKVLTMASLRKLETYHWPGNVRELANAIQRAMVCCLGRKIMPADISLNGQTNESQRSRGGNNLRAAKQSLIASFERAYLEELLARHQGNITQAARDAGKDRRALGRLIKKYNIRTTADKVLR